MEETKPTEPAPVEQAADKPAPAPKKESAPAKKETAPKAAPAKSAGGKIAVILVRSTVRAPQSIIDTLNMLKLYKKHNCSILDNTPSNAGMVNKVKDYVTFGTVDDATIKLLAEKGSKEEKGISRYCLNPPKGGFERKGIKRNFGVGGALGNRREKIGLLIKKML